MAQRKWFDELFDGIADAVADIREKVVEEPWFGRVVTERESAAPQWPEVREAQPEPPAQDRDRSPDMDIDR